MMQKYLDIKNINEVSTSTKIKAKYFFSIPGKNFNPNDHYNQIIKDYEYFITDDSKLKNKEKVIFLDKKDYYIDKFNYYKNPVNSFLCNSLISKNIFLQSKCKVIGVTGTNGKTTTSYILKQLLEKANKKVSYFGTLGYIHQGLKTKSKYTSPPIQEYYDFVLKALSHSDYLIIEVSSHAGAQSRIDSFLFDYLVFTNFASDHLDFHKTKENYYLSKMIFTQQLKKQGKIIKFENDKNINDYFNKYKIEAVNYKKEDLEESIIKKSKVIGSYNLDNLAAAKKIIDFENIKTNYENLELASGRFKLIEKNDYKVIIDFAHSPDAIENILNEVQSISKKITCIFGSTGERDANFKSEMGRVASKYCQKIIVTEDNAMGVDQEKIFNDIINNNDKSKFELIKDRKDAIIKAISLLQKDECLVILGKGDENYQYLDFNKKIKKPYEGDESIVLKGIKNVY